MNAQSRTGIWQRLPPPLVFALPLIVGILLERRWPLVGSHPSWSRGLEWGGIVLIVLGVAHALPSIVLFVRTRTTIIPHHASAALVTRGPYRWTRNPMYVSLVLEYLGVAALFGSVWALLLLPLPVLIVHLAVIPMEERQLEGVFGSQYREYKARVRRWI